MSKKERKSQSYALLPLTPKLVEKHSQDICKSLDQIPGVDPHSKEQLLLEERADRVFYKKWEHSFILIDGEVFVGIIIGYERESEGNDQYPHNSMYLSDLAVSSEYQRQGIGTFLVGKWLEHNRQVGFLELDDELRFSVQTNKADWNAHVQKLYEGFGFEKVAEKAYGNRVDNVYYLSN